MSIRMLSSAAWARVIGTEAPSTARATAVVRARLGLNICERDLRRAIEPTDVNELLISFML